MSLFQCPPERANHSLGEEVQNGFQQGLQLFQVRPSCREEMESKERVFTEKMPRHIQKYLIHNNVQQFVYPKPFRKQKQKNKDNEFEVL